MALATTKDHEEKGWELVKGGGRVYTSSVGTKLACHTTLCFGHDSEGLGWGAAHQALAKLALAR
jgi:hypothetical protein